MKNILFVCTGNTCRSPLAEGIMRHMAQQGGLDLTVSSAGVSAMNGMDISAHSKQILRNKGIDDHLTSRSLTAEAVEQADLILTMTVDHKRHVIERFNEALGKVFTLKEYVEDDPAVLELIAEKEKMEAELQMKQSLSQEITEDERIALFELERSMPDYDVHDPIGGSLEEYEQCATEIETHLVKLIDKLRGQSDGAG